MKANNLWSFKHYLPFDLNKRLNSPYICRIEPGESDFSFDFYDINSSGISYVLYWNKRNSECINAVNLSGTTGYINGLEPNTEYVFRVESSDGRSSTQRIVKTGYAPGKIINYLHPEDTEYDFSGKYLCSPSIIRLPNGTLLASMDLFNYGTPQNLSIIYQSKDNGKTWTHLTELYPLFWGKMFICNGKLYMIGCSTEYGDLIIGRSDDNGETWTSPTVIFRGACHSRECGWHKAPNPVLIHNGRVMIDVQYGTWAKPIFCNAVISAPADSDLLNTSNWVCTDLLDPPKHIEKRPEGVWCAIEGSLVVAPDGSIVNILRSSDRILMQLNYDPNNPEKRMCLRSFTSYPGNASKFNVIFDEFSKKYLAIISWSLDHPKTLRNLLSLVESDDLVEWKLVKHLIDYRDSDPQKVGFQYVDFIIDGDDILYLTRASLNGANNFHDANYTLFNRINNFRELL